MVRTLWGGVKHKCGEETNNILFVDDATLLSESEEHMQALLTCVDKFCEWTGVRINVEKSEITGYNFRTSRELPTSHLNMSGMKLKTIRPWDTFKYLGVRMTATGDMSAERKYVKDKTLSLIQKIKNHQYDPQQIQWVVQIAIIPIFRYSAAIADWSMEELQQMDRIWARGLRSAWKVGIGTPDVTFWAPKEKGGLEYWSAQAIMVRETIGLLQQCQKVKDDLSRMVVQDFEDAIQERGCDSITEVQQEIRWERQQGIEIEDRNTITLCQRFLEYVTDVAEVEWEDMFVNRGQMGQSIMGIMSVKPDPKFSEEGWIRTRKWLRTLPTYGIYNLGQLLLDKQTTLPDRWRKEMGIEGEVILRHIIESKGGQLTWGEKEDQRLHGGDRINIRPPDVGEALVGGLVRKFHKQSWVIGRVTEAEAEEEAYKYKVTFHDGKMMHWNLAQVQQNWYINWRQQRQEWTREDQVGLCSIIQTVLGETQASVMRRVISPFPHRIQDTEWEDTEKWYTCMITTSFTSTLKDLLQTRSSKGNDRKIAQHMVQEATVLWVPRSTWPNWPITTQACKLGWWVRVEDLEEDDDNIRVVVKSLHQDEFHRRGTIGISGAKPGSGQPVGIRQIEFQTPPRLGTFSEAELGGLEMGGYVICEAMLTYKEKEKEKLAKNQPRSVRGEVPKPIVRGDREVEVELDTIHFEEDWEAGRVETQTVVWGRNEQKVMYAKGQAHLLSLAAKDKGKKEKRTLKQAGAKTKTRKGTYPIEWARKEVLQHWFTSKEMTNDWQERWKSQDKWEASGGRTLNWTVTSRLRQKWNLGIMIRAKALTADPSFTQYVDVEEDPDSWGTVKRDAMGRIIVEDGTDRRAVRAAQPEPGMGVLVPIYEMNERQTDHWLTYLTGKNYRWVMIVKRGQLTESQHQLLSREGEHVSEIKRGERLALEKGWWKTGERKGIQLKHSIQIWRSKAVISDWELQAEEEDDIDRDIELEDQIAEEAQERGQEEQESDEEEEKAAHKTEAEKEYGQEWAPWRWLEKESESMTRYLNALPSGLYRKGEGGWLVATDGSLRKNPATKLVEWMGSGVAWQHDRLPRVSTRIGGRLSSTRAELAAVDMALGQSMQIDTSDDREQEQKHMTILIDSSAAVGRLRWFKRKDFKPPKRKIKDFDILEAIVQKLKIREEKGLITRFVKVTGHTGEPLHAIADGLATAGAETEPKEDEVLPYQPEEQPTDLIFKFHTVQTQKLVRQPWGPQMAQKVRKTAAWNKWKNRKQGTHATAFHQEEYVGRGLLGDAVRSVHSWALRGWIKSITPYQYPVNQTFHKWKKVESAKCECGAEVESVNHVQLSCTLTARRKTRQKVHNKMMKVIQEAVEHEKVEGRQSIWDSQAKELFPELKQQGDVQDLIDRWRKGPAMNGEDKEFQIWHHQMRRRWRTQREAAKKRRSLTERNTEQTVEIRELAEQILENLGTPTVVPKTTTLTPQAAQARARRAAAEKSAHAITGKRKRGRTGEISRVGDKWEYDRQEEDLQKLLPDGLIVDKGKRVIYILEGARTDDNICTIKNVSIKKSERYKRLVDALRRLKVGYHIKQMNFIMGMRGTIQEDKWRRQLQTLGFKEPKIERIIKKCMRVSIEGMQEVMWSSQKEETGEKGEEVQGKENRQTVNQRRSTPKVGVG